MWSAAAWALTTRVSRSGGAAAVLHTADAARVNVLHHFEGSRRWVVVAFALRTDSFASKRSTGTVAVETFLPHAGRWHGNRTYATFLCESLYTRPLVSLTLLFF